MSEEESHFDCGICLDKCADPVVTQCGHLFCWPCLGKWFQRGHNDCPNCKALCTRENIIPVYGRGRSRTNTNTSGEGTEDSARPTPNPERTAGGGPQEGQRPSANRPPSPRRGAQGGFYMSGGIWPFAMFEANTEPLGWNDTTKSRVALYIGTLCLFYLIVVV